MRPRPAAGTPGADPAADRSAHRRGPIAGRGQRHWADDQQDRTAPDLAHGGQTVLSGATEEIVADHSPPGAWLLPLGSHQLRDLRRAERVIQLCDPDLHNQFPPLRLPAAVSEGLPLQLTSFVGRKAQIPELSRIVAKNRLVTLTAPAVRARPASPYKSLARSPLNSATAHGTSTWRRSPNPTLPAQRPPARSGRPRFPAAPRRTLYCGSSPIGRCCCYWTTASTCWMRRPHSSAPCSGPARV